MVKVSESAIKIVINDKRRDAKGNLENRVTDEIVFKLVERLESV